MNEAVYRESIYPELDALTAGENIPSVPSNVATSPNVFPPYVYGNGNDLPSTPAGPGAPGPSSDGDRVNTPQGGRPSAARSNSGAEGRAERDEAEWDRIYHLTPDGVEELRRKWEVEYADLVMAPPPPGIFPSREAAITSAKAFAKEHEYQLVIGHSYKTKQGETNRILLACELAGEYRNHHGVTPETRQRNRFSRKTNCPMRCMVQKKRFSQEWVLVIKCVEHNHPVVRRKAKLRPSQMPDLEAALYDWHMSELAKGDIVHGNTLKSRALALFAEMPQYRGKDAPNLDREWLNQYRLRFKLPGSVTMTSAPTDPEVLAREQRPPTPPPIVDPYVAQEYAAFGNLDHIFPDPGSLDPLRRFVQDYMSRYDASHNWKHVVRVFQLARRVLDSEQTWFQEKQYDGQLVLLAALMHDIGDHKYVQQGENPENQIAETLLEYGVDATMAMKVQLVAKNVSFSNEIKNPRMMKAVLEQHPELAIVQDADRLDAIGAIGIARTFTFGGAKQPDRGMEGSIAHFVEKLERLENMMKTETGKRMARERTQRLQVFRQWWEEENAMIV